MSSTREFWARSVKLGADGTFFPVHSVTYGAHRYVVMPENQNGTFVWITYWYLYGQRMSGQELSSLDQAQDVCEAHYDLIKAKEIEDGAPARTMLAAEAEIRYAAYMAYAAKVSEIRKMCR